MVGAWNRLYQLGWPCPLPGWTLPHPLLKHPYTKYEGRPHSALLPLSPFCAQLYFSQ
ncbi:hypothetical protein I79_008334 [Cricetulus griseus]|uniref:Uncharacterized protein n=1 Tax=Cricetulus griseus TaxID=10029 RepID=G3HCW6_CRIGR|nr:hypothetical protein I79_008334 [Cricetulus griseus]